MNPNLNPSQVRERMNLQAQCIITGCALVDGRHWVAGDLFEYGDCYIFCGNTVREEGRVEPCWVPIEMLHYAKRLEPTYWFERNGVFVMLKDLANLNESARHYIGDLS